MDRETVPSSSVDSQQGVMETGSYIVRTLITDVPLSAEEDSRDVKITCVEVWDENLYIGTSAAEILHFVRIPPEPSDSLGQPSYILASRQQPPFIQTGSAGIQQILILPTVGKACVLCNNTLNFYSLPELSPAFPALKPFSCTWVGGLDENLEKEQANSEDGVVIMICVKTKIRLVRVFDDEIPKPIRNIEFAGGLATVRRGDFACAADARSYSLLDVVNQRKIPLFPISSLDEQAEDSARDLSDNNNSATSHAASRSVSHANSGPQPGHQVERGHGRSTSLGVFGSDTDRRRHESPRPSSSRRYGFDAPGTLPRVRSPQRPASTERTTPEPQPAESTRTSQDSARTPLPVRPLVCSPTPMEFLLTRAGTTPSEPGVGLFVNLDGDVVRGTVEFSSYPDAIVLDGRGYDILSPPDPAEVPEEGFVLASMRRREGDQELNGVEIQRWDLDPSEGGASKEWLNLSSVADKARDYGSGEVTTKSLGIRSIVSQNEVPIPEISQKLALRRLDLGALQNMNVDDPTVWKREREEIEFANRLATAHARTVLWSDSQIGWVLRNPLIIQLDAKLTRNQMTTTSRSGDRLEPNRQEVKALLNSIQGREPRTEAEFLGLKYIRQKASLLLFVDLILRTGSGIVVSEHEKRFIEESLSQGDIDPRVVLMLLPILRDEIVQGVQGIWVQGGLKQLLETTSQQSYLAEGSIDPSGPFGDNLLQVTKRYLYVWRRKKGFGSIADSPEVFRTVDAALLHLLLLLDGQSPKGPATAGSYRTELYGIVDHDVECFERAVSLLEEYHRLYVLSRLYQSRKMYAQVLATWKRIIEGEFDAGGEFVDGEQELRRYLSGRRDAALVEDYGTWLARRNPKLGVQVFADNNSKVRFQTTQALAILREKAPDAVKEYLEHLVFGKKQTQYANDLIEYYLDIVLDAVESSEMARTTLQQTYETYRALRPPKPTYRQFITDNAIDAAWWRSRLRLLQLLGSSQDPAASYDVSTILSRLAPYKEELVPEMIILNGRQGRHQEAIRLLTHGLGDFDTAISYCLLGGSSIFRPVSGFVPQEAIPSRDEQAKLFGYLLEEFLRIEDISDRIERTGELLERFGGWFDVASVLSMIPDSWSIDILSSFLVNALRQLVKERSETTITKALSGAQNLRVSAKLVDEMERVGPTVEKVR